MTAEQKMVTFTIDGREVTVPPGTLVIRAAEQLGIYVPRFCDHPLLDPVGACRQCLVEVEGQRKPLTSCTTVATEGMVVKTQFTSEVAKDAQEGVLELLLINHPLDCPMCDKGGECPLQDQALAYGPGGSRFIDEKRRYAKPIPISPLVKLDRERCVLCARCTRFADQIAGDPFIELFERGALEQVAIFHDEPYESIFSGNVTQICPVGALLSSTFRFRARPFDMTSTPSTCNLCASGCSIEVQERRGEITRVLARDNAAVNDEWSCDKGRYGYAYNQVDERVTEPLVRKDGEFVAVSWGEAMSLIADRLSDAFSAGRRIGVLGGQQLLDEDSYALSRFARTVLHTNDVDMRSRAGVPGEEDVLAAIVQGRTATNEDIDRAGVVLVIGADLHEESPIVFLRLRKNARKRGMKIHEIGGWRSALVDSGATWTPCAPGSEASLLDALGRAVAARRDGGSADEGDLGSLADLLTSGGPVVVLAGDHAAASPGTLARAWNLAVALGGRFGWVPRKAGARGAAWAGLLPGSLPGGRRVADAAQRDALAEVWGSVPAAPGRDAAAILDEAGGLGALYLVGVDPVTDFADSDLAARAIAAAPFVVAHDLFLTETSRQADVILPAASAYERDGTLTNWEGRAQRVRGALGPRGVAQSDAEILIQLAHTMTATFPTSVEALRAEMEQLRGEVIEPQALDIADAVPAREDGVGGARTFSLAAMRPLLDNGTMMKGADALKETRPAAVVELNVRDAEGLGIAAGDTVRIRTERGELRAPVSTSHGIAPGTVFIPSMRGELEVERLMSADSPVTRVTVEKA